MQGEPGPQGLTGEQGPAGPAGVFGSHTMWVHGNSVEVRYHDDASTVTRFSDYGRVALSSEPGWFYFAVPTVVPFDGGPLIVDACMVRFQTFGSAKVYGIYVWDGNVQIGGKAVLLTHSAVSTYEVDVKDRAVSFGLTISVKAGKAGDDVAFGDKIEFVAAGCRFYRDSP